MQQVVWDSFPNQQVDLIDAGGFPLAVPAGGGVTELLSAQFNVPTNESWVVTMAGGVFTVDNSLVTVAGGYLDVTPPASSPHESIALVLTTSQISLNWAIFVGLAGIVLGPGDVLTAVIRWGNSDVAIRNVTAGAIGIRYLPYRLVSEIAIAQLRNQQVDVNLAERLRSRR
jgi:hypothetical protein